MSADGKCKYFKIVTKNNELLVGLYYGRTPEHAARKACRRLMTDEIICGNSVENGIKFYITEIKKDNPKVYCFWGSKIKNAVEFVIDGEIVGQADQYVVTRLCNQSAG